jgi:hypothetical protein
MPRYFARKAERCRELSKVARVPEAIEQPRLWAPEFETAVRERTERDRRRRARAPILCRRARGGRA